MKLAFKIALVPVLIGIWLLIASIDKAQIYQVKSGSGFSQVSKDLNSKALLVLSKIMDVQLKAGYYQIDKNMRVIDLMNNFDKAQVKTVNITLIEGQTIRDYYQQLNENQALKSSGDFHQTLQLTGAKDPYDGLFWADTYQVNYGDSVLSVLKRAYRIMQYKLRLAWQGRALNLALDNAYQALILASLIEKETAYNQEKSRIAGVFMRRLQMGMRLQTDPTVVYALGDRYQGRLSRQDLRFDSPYNTYRYKGLPPSPIGAVSATSLHAAMHPAAGDSLYFVAKKNGMHAFAKTYQQHRLNIKKYLK